ncbi:B12-binding domain-containing radical SAM protein [Chitinophaga sp. RAB17]|uniref:B12-binding domain-containing radical SAM protein n=1 Tax=Chitinophaga sp. RAB17 TaxID=3233049 RepID=UPI003F91BE99
MLSAPENCTANKRILLLSLPFWTPSIPPLGISLLKSLLQENGFDVRTHDANMDFAFREIYGDYFSVIKSVVPAYNQGNFFNIGMDVMRNQMLAHINYTDRQHYSSLIKEIIRLHYYCDIDDNSIDQLISILDECFVQLKNFITEQIADYQPTTIGLSVFSGNLASSVFCFREIKKINPEIETIMGGGTFSMELAINNPNFERLLAKEGKNIDKFFVGEGDLLVLRYFQGMLDGNKKIYQLADLPGKNLQVTDIPVPDFSDLDIDKYPQIGYWTARSCPFQCSFCSETIYWGKYRKKGAEKMVDDMTLLSGKYGSQIFMMGDSLLNPVIDQLAHEMIRQNTALYFDGYLRADPPVCKIENTLLWRKGGLYRARLGVESGSPGVLEIMNKKISVEQIKESLRALAVAGIKTTTYWIVGHPGETEEDFQMTLDVIEEMADFIWEAEPNPFGYYLTGQVNSDKWMSAYKRQTIFSEEYTEMLQVQTWEMQGCEPVREEIYRRVNRFVEHCYKLGIPNPYSEKEIYDADVRWKRLHANAVPALVEFRNKEIIINDFSGVTDGTQSDNLSAEVDFIF